MSRPCANSGRLRTQADRQEIGLDTAKLCLQLRDRCEPSSRAISKSAAAQLQPKLARTPKTTDARAAHAAGHEPVPEPAVVSRLMHAHNPAPYESSFRHRPVDHADPAAQPCCTSCPTALSRAVSLVIAYW